MSELPTRADCEALDAADPLRDFRDRFDLPAQRIYLDGNSLGALPRATAARLERAIRAEWGEALIASWNEAGWVEAPRRVGDKIGRLIGARPGETVVADSTSINLYKALAMALALRPDRRTILMQGDDFPTDLYMAQGLVAQLGGVHRIERLPPGADGARIAAALHDDVAVLALSHVNYRSGAMLPVRAVCRAARAVGALVLWDLAHSVGAVPLDVSEDGADFAVGCGYKYLNGGPGAPAFLYVAQRWHGRARSPLTGWFGHADPFAFVPDYAPAADIAQTLCGTPPILSLTALEVGVDLMLEAPMPALREKSVALCERFIERAEARLGPFGFTLASPREPAHRGSQVCLRHPEAWPICQALIARGVVGDFRAPDILRFGFAPLYTRFVDGFDAVERLHEVMRDEVWRAPEFARRAKVT